VNGGLERVLKIHGRDLTQGPTLWDLYEAFKAPKNEDETRAIFKRRLSIPLPDMDRVMARYKEWEQSELEFKKTN